MNDNKPVLNSGVLHKSFKSKVAQSQRLTWKLQYQVKLLSPYPKREVR